MTPSIKKAAKAFEKIATKKKINLEKVDIDRLNQMIMATQICEFKSEKLFLFFVETALDKLNSK
jgi:hypothetical protein